MMGVGPGSREGDFIDWLTIKSQTESVASSTHPYVRHKEIIFELIA
jgi:hypothetical protein